MIKNVLEMLDTQYSLAVQRLAKERAYVQDSISQDYVVGSGTMESLIKAQKSVSHWAKIKNILAKEITDEARVETLREWVEAQVDRMLDCGRSRSTSLVASAEYEADDDELRVVVRDVRNAIRHLDSMK